MYYFKGLDHIQLAAPKAAEEEAREFFAGILGMKETPKPENLAKRGGVWFQCGSHQLHIGIQDEFSPAKKAHPAFEVDHLEGLKKRIQENNIEVIEDEPLQGQTDFTYTIPSETAWSSWNGCKSFWFNRFCCKDNVIK